MLQAGENAFSWSRCELALTSQKRKTCQLTFSIAPLSLRVHPVLPPAPARRSAPFSKGDLPRQQRVPLRQRRSAASLSPLAPPNSALDAREKRRPLPLSTPFRSDAQNSLSGLPPRPPPLLLGLLAARHLFLRSFRSREPPRGIHRVRTRPCSGRGGGTDDPGRGGAVDRRC